MEVESLSDDYDSPWKEALDRFLPDCLRLLFPQVHALVDWSRPYEVLKPELPLQLADGTGKRSVDFLAKVWLLDGREETLYLHIEAQAQWEADFPGRIFEYWRWAGVRYGTFPLSLVFFTDDNPKWKPVLFEFAFAGLTLSFEYPAVKLLDWRNRRAELEADDNPFAAFVLAHLDTRDTKGDFELRAARKAALLMGLIRRKLSPDEMQKIVYFVDWLMRVPEKIFLPYYNQYIAFAQENAMPYVTTFERYGIEKGIEQGIEKGIEKGRILQLKEDLATDLEIKFGKPGLEFAVELNAVDDLARLKTIRKSALSASSLEELRELVK